MTFCLKPLNRSDMSVVSYISEDPVSGWGGKNLGLYFILLTYRILSRKKELYETIYCKRHDLFSLSGTC